MAFVITQRCCNDASCVDMCPVDCIRPTPDQPEFATTEMLHIDPHACIDCGACVPACPVSAIRYEDDLPDPMKRYKDVNADYFAQHPLHPEPTLFHQPIPGSLSLNSNKLRIAVVGAGPAACYAAEELLARGDVEVTMLDRLPTPYGLIRAGVAPDHWETKGVSDTFAHGFVSNDVDVNLNVEVGEHISHSELMQHHHGVIYAVGAVDEGRLKIRGEELPGVHSALEFVAWYNGHPEYSTSSFDLSGQRVVIVGNGNVALDAARILVTDVGQLHSTDIAGHALDTLRDSNIREVVLLGRRGPLQAAYSSSEFLAFGYLPGVDVVIDQRELQLDPLSKAQLEDPECDPALRRKVALAGEFSHRRADPTNKRVTFRYLASPSEIVGTERVEAIRITHNELVGESGVVVARPTNRNESIDTSLVLRSTGFRGHPVPDLPFDEQRAIVPNRHGRVIDGEGRPMTGVYVTGWIKRGATGTIGTNKHCARDTVASLLDDVASGRLKDPEFDREALGKLLKQRQPQLISKSGWRAIDHVERQRGRSSGRPRLKITAVAEMTDIAAESTTSRV